MSIITVTGNLRIITVKLILKHFPKLDIIGKIHQFVHHVILNAKNVHYAMQKVVVVMIVSIFVKMLNQKLTKIILSDGEHGYIVDLVFRMFNFYIISNKYLNFILFLLLHTLLLHKFY